MTDPATMEAGPELDGLIAQFVMGWHWRSLPTPSHYEMAADGCMGSRWFDGNRDTRRDKGWRPSTGMADAWEVVAYLNARGRRLLIQVYHGGTVAAGTWEDGFESIAGAGPAEVLSYPKWIERATADDAPLAICRAALLAIGWPDNIGTICPAGHPGTEGPHGSDDPASLDGPAG